MGPDKIVVVKRQTPLEELLVRHSTTSQAEFYLEAAGHSYMDYETAHNTYKSGLKNALAAIPSKVRTQIVDKRELATFQFGDKDLVVVVGDDGLFVNAAKYVGEQLVISVNPDEERFDGVLSSCNASEFPKVLRKTLEGKAETQLLTMAEARLDDGQVIRALNDLFIGRKTHVSARYAIGHKRVEELHSSDGIVVSTGTGSTGWLTSIVTGAMAITSGKPSLLDGVPFGRDANYLVFAVMNPFPSKVTGNQVVYGEITRHNTLKIKSNMPEEGVIFGDGVEKDYLEFTSGRTAVVQPSNNKIRLVKVS